MLYEKLVQIYKRKGLYSTFLQAKVKNITNYFNIR